MQHSFQPPGIWFSITRDATLHQSNAAPGTGLILDRDGVLVREMNYLCAPEDVSLQQDAVALLRWANAARIPVAVATNQSGIARGMFGWSEFEAVEDEIALRLRQEQAHVDLVVACPFHPDYTTGYSSEQAYWRKPGPGMLRFAGKQLGFALNRSWLIGDKESDIAAAKAAGMAGAFFHRNAEYAVQEEAALTHADSGFTVRLITDAQEATRHIST